MNENQARAASNFKLRIVVPEWIKGEPLAAKALIETMRGLGAVAKSRRNVDQKFNFRGIDDVYNMLHDVLATAGLVSIPAVLERIDGERATKNGGSMAHVKLLVEYHLVAGDGSSIVVGPVWGEALDTSDKASNKALAFAHKYAMLQTFTIPTEDTRETLEEREGDLRSQETTGPVQREGQGHTVPAPQVVVMKFAEVNITRAQLEEKFGKPIEKFDEKEYDKARELYREIRENPQARALHFNSGPPRELMGNAPATPPAAPPATRPQSNPADRLNQRVAGSK